MANGGASPALRWKLKPARRREASEPDIPTSTETATGTETGEPVRRLKPRARGNGGGFHDAEGQVQSGTFEGMEGTSPRTPQPLPLELRGPTAVASRRHREGTGSFSTLHPSVWRASHHATIPQLGDSLNFLRVMPDTARAGRATPQKRLAGLPAARAGSTA
jgi:hypothetical protein